MVFLQEESKVLARTSGGFFGCVWPLVRARRERTAEPDHLAKKLTQTGEGGAPELQSSNALHTPLLSQYTAE